MLPSMPVLAISAAVVLGAGFIRGFSGFGFAIFTVVVLSMILKPAQVVPVVLLLELSASIWMLPGVWKDINWRSLIWLGLGALVGTPIGVYLLATVPVGPMRAGIAVAVLLLAVLLRQGYRLKQIPGRKGASLVGLISGVLNGGAAMPGPPIILFYYSSPLTGAAGRASLVAFFFGSGAWGAAAFAAKGLLTAETCALAGVLLIPLVMGLILGSRSFLKTDEALFRQRVMFILMLVALAALGRAILT